MQEVIIVGAGIAGLTAAIYAKRKKMDFVLLGERFGGQFLESGKINNYPAITETGGTEFSKMFEKQLKFNQIEPKVGEKITKISKVDSGFKLEGKKDNYQAKTVIIATGSHPKKLGIKGEEEFANKGLTYCSICDGPLFSGKTIAVIGGGNSALEGVDFTHKIAKKIYLINIDQKFNAHQELIDKATAYHNLEVINEAESEEILGEKMVTGLKYKKEGKTHKLDLDGVIVEIGRTPNTDFLEGFLKLNEKKHVVIDCQSKTSVEGVFAAGDCASGNEYQYTIAAGQGCIALLKAARYLAGKK
ncbi:MAG: NAD(P)/FAD-dependent oxidoreductase [Candidatus Omnitrophica bacterium]|nr:NAD(P)/FAD-dependent oxidoreductase [Candidatus Omnitrophota bacterium]MCF7898134.1 NAD(P)/FAD-dependent oxidoreductase [Candidatus Omnitrophota bacterium]